MLALVSPAKSLDFASPHPIAEGTQPELLQDAEQLNQVLRSLNAADLRQLMGISEKLAALNEQRNRDWHTPFTSDNARPALAAFKGDVYAGLQAATMSDEALTFAQDHLRILSGLYGLLRPLDLIQPYRLEMGTRLAVGEHADLYAFWGERITELIDRELRGQSGEPVLVNLASNEYFKSVQPKRLSACVVTPVFKDCKRGVYKIISFYAKKARGMMVRHIIDQRLNDPEGLKTFTTAGYYFVPEASDDATLMFHRDEVD